MSDKPTPNERLEALRHLHDAALADYNPRRQHEWQLTLSLWGAIGGFIVLVASDKLQFTVRTQSALLAICIAVFSYSLFIFIQFSRERNEPLDHLEKHEGKAHLGKPESAKKVSGLIAFLSFLALVIWIPIFTENGNNYWEVLGAAITGIVSSIILLVHYYFCRGVAKGNSLNRRVQTFFRNRILEILEVNLPGDIRSSECKARKYQSVVWGNWAHRSKVIVTALLLFAAHLVMIQQC